MSEALKQAYASLSDDPIYAIRLVHAGLTNKSRAFIGMHEDLETTLEDGSPVTYQSTGMELSLPEKSGMGKQDISFALSNVSLEAAREIDWVKSYNRQEVREGREPEKIYLELRIFVASDLSVPKALVRMIVQDTVVDLRKVSLRASFLELANTEWPKRRYYPEFFPGTKYV